MPPPIPTVFHCLVCGMMWVRPKSWQRTRFGPSGAGTVSSYHGDHCSLGLTEFCNGTIVATQDPLLVDAALAAHQLGHDSAVAELALANMGSVQKIRVEINNTFRR